METLLAAASVMLRENEIERAERARPHVLTAMGVLCAGHFPDVRRVIPEADCREAIAAFMVDWNRLPPTECAELMAQRLRALLAKHGAAVARGATCG